MLVKFLEKYKAAAADQAIILSRVRGGDGEILSANQVDDVLRGFRDLIQVGLEYEWPADELDKIAIKNVQLRLPAPPG